MKKVYLLDDERWIIRGITKLVDWASMDFEVIGTQVNSTIGLNEILELKPDIVITDIQMPNINGLELIQKLRDNGFKGVFIIISGYADFSYVQKALSYDVVEYCLKPVEADELTQALVRAAKKLGDDMILNSLTQRNEEVKSKNKSLNELIDYIKYHFTENLSLQFLADEFYMNASYLSNLFTKELGMSYSAYLAGIRLEYACKLLRETENSVTDIATESGFSNYYYFARVFKKKFGVTPSEYRDNT